MAELRRLGDVCEISREQSRPAASDQRRYIGLEHIKAGTGEILPPAADEAPFKGPGFSFDARHVLYGKLRPYLNKVALPEEAGRCSMELVPLLPAPEVERDFLAALLRHPRTVEHVSSRNTGSRMPRADMGLLLDFKVPVPPLDEQRNIVDLLSCAASLKRLAEQAQAKTRELIPALFADIFGDPAKGWPIVPLSEVSQIRSGITKGRRTTGDLQAVSYLRVANVQDGHLDLATIKEIEATPEEMARFALLPGDLLLTEGGDPDKLGRGAIWQGQIEPCIHQNHVFAVRVDQVRVLPGYAAAVTGSQYGKAYFLSVAKRTTGIASINKTQLGRFPIPLPPLALQETFVHRMEEVVSVQGLAERAAIVAERTSAALMSQLFAP